MGAGIQRWWLARRYEAQCAWWVAQQFARLDRQIIDNPKIALRKNLQRLQHLVELLRQIGKMS